MSFRDHPCACDTAPADYDCSRACYWSALSAQAERGIRSDQVRRIEGTDDRIQDLRWTESATGRSQFKTTKRNT